MTLRRGKGSGVVKSVAITIHTRRKEDGDAEERKPRVPTAYIHTVP